MRRLGWAVVALTALLPVVARAEIKIEKPWVRETIGAGKITAGYGKITNTGDDSDILLSVTTPVAATAELHQSMDKGGRMTMAPVARLEIPRMGAVELKPGGYHLMCVSPSAAMIPGHSVPVTLHFKDGGAVMASFPVRGVTGK